MLPLHSVLLVSALVALANPFRLSPKEVKRLLKGREGELKANILEYLKEKEFAPPGTGGGDVVSLDYYRVKYGEALIIADITVTAGGLPGVLNTFPCSAVIYIQPPILEEQLDRKQPLDLKDLFEFDPKTDIKCVVLRDVPLRVC